MIKNIGLAILFLLGLPIGVAAAQQLQQLQQQQLQQQQQVQQQQQLLIGPEIYRHYYLDMTNRIDSKGS